MKKELSDILIDSTNLAAVRDRIIALFEKKRQETGSTRIGYVAGILNSDGPEKVQENRRKLAEYADRVRNEQDFPIFCSADIFSEDAVSDGLFAQLEEVRLGGKEKHNAFIQFWREILRSGKVTDIFMTPRWEKSVGATDEHETATRLGIRIHYIRG